MKQILTELFVLQPELPWSIHFGMNAAVDFCIWILEVDGLHVPPFTCHEQRWGALQKLGFTSERWLVWARAAIALFNPALSWNRDAVDLDVWVQGQLADLEQLANLMLQSPQWAGQAVDIEALRYPLECHYQQHQERFQEAEAALAEINPQMAPFIKSIDWKQLPAADLLEQPLREPLLLLWDIYNQQVYPIREQATATGGEQSGRTGRGKLYDVLEQLNVYVVSYPFKVEWLVPPDTVVTSNRHLLLDTDAMDELIERSVYQLAVAIDILSY